MSSLRTAGFLIVCLACLTAPAQMLAQSKNSSASSTPRIWTDASGKHKVRAKLVEVENGTVHLRRTDTDADISIPLEKLSKADQEWVAKHNTAAERGESQGGRWGQGGYRAKRRPRRPLGAGTGRRMAVVAGNQP